MCVYFCLFGARLILIRATWDHIRLEVPGLPGLRRGALALGEGEQTKGSIGEATRCAPNYRQGLRTLGAPLQGGPTASVREMVLSTPGGTRTRDLWLIRPSL